MATISELVGSSLGIPEPSARFLLALFSAYPLAIFYRAAVSRQSSNIQNAYFTLTGLSVLYYIYGLTIWHSVVDVLAVYVVLKVCGGSLVSLSLSWIISMGHLVCGYLYVMHSNQVHPISWTIPHCVLVLKLIGVTYNVYDGKKKPENQTYEQKMLSINRVPTLLELTGFVYFFGSQLAGPQIPFKRHTLFCEGQLFNWSSVPTSIPTAVRWLLLGVFFAILYSVCNQFFPISFLVSDEYLNYSFPMRMIFMVLCGKVALWRYISVWLIAEGSCIWTGISYTKKGLKNELDVLAEDVTSGQNGGGGEVSWHALANINVLDFELGVSLEGVIDCFNMNTNKWMLWYVFKRLRFLGNRTLSWSLTMAFISLWHGVWPGYYITFSLEMLDIMAERNLRLYCYHMFGYSVRDASLPLQIVLYVAAFIVKNLLLLYPLVTFMLLDWAQCYKFMKSVYFFCHVVVLGWLILYQVLPKPRSLPKRIHTAAHNGTNGTTTNGASSSSSLKMK